MNKENINYLKRALDLHHCLDKFINVNLEENNEVFVLHLNSRTTDKKLFVNTIWKHFRDRVIKNSKNKYNIKYGVGGVEKDSNGFWHIHLLITYNKNYADNTRYNLNTELRSLWLKLNKKYTGEELEDERFLCEKLKIDKKNNLVNYISKPVKHTKRTTSIFTKVF